MSKEFKASNGLTIRPHTLDAGGVAVTDGAFSTIVESAELTALREFFEWEASRNPWDDAEPGEIWALTVDGVEDAYDRMQDCWFKNGSAIKPHPDKITAGRRIWPENAS